MTQAQGNIVIPLKVVEVVATLTHLLGDNPDDYQSKIGAVMILWHLPVALTYYTADNTFEVDVDLDAASVRGEYIANRVKLYAVIGFCKAEKVVVNL